ncbi:MAG: VWA domain-containing protein [bacterium]
MEITFAFPQIFLLGFLLIPAIFIFLIIYYYNRKKSVLLFSEYKTLEKIAISRVSFKRFLIIFLDLLAMFILFLALGRPQAPVTLPASGYVVGIIIDISGSMMATDFWPSRISVAKDAAKILINNLKGNFEACLVTFNNNVFVNQALTNSKEDLLLALSLVNANYGGTAIGDAIITTLAILENSSMPHKVIVLLTDGENNAGTDPIIAAKKAKDKKIPIYSIGLGTSTGSYIPGIPYPVRIDEATLKEISKLTGGEYYYGNNVENLKKAYKIVSEKVGKIKKNQDISSVFAGIALFILLIKLILNSLLIRTLEI